MAMTAALVLVPAAARRLKPFVPQGDSVVLERLPEKGDPALAQLKRMRSGAGRATGGSSTSRFPLPARRSKRRASSAIRAFSARRRRRSRPWWNGDTVPPAALLLRATLKQSQHDFARLARDLDRCSPRSRPRRRRG